MTPLMRALAGLALLLPMATGARPSAAAKPPVTAKQNTAKAAHPAKAKTPHAAPDAEILPSPAALRVIQWVSASNDNHALPWAVVDKTNAALFLFDPKAKQLAAVPVLVGIATGDEASPGVGTKKLADLGPAEKTTPAGRFLAKFGLPVSGEHVLWVDYATSVALHPIPKDVGPKEKRRERMLSPTPDDNRITFGCINVPKLFYSRLLSPAFRKKGGYVYVLPDTKPIEEVFPRLRVQAVTGAGI